MTSLAANSARIFIRYCRYALDRRIQFGAALSNNGNRDGVSLVSTPTPREVFVENWFLRIEIREFNHRTFTVYVGQTYNYTVNASTATGGYEQLEGFLSLQTSVFRVHFDFYDLYSPDRRNQ
jgi:uracil-DNA glycosylase